MCQVRRQTFDGFDSLLSISRGCVAKCPYGCYYHNYGATTIVCTSCCRSRACNVGNSASRCVTSPLSISMLLQLMLMVFDWHLYVVYSHSRVRYSWYMRSMPMSRFTVKSVTVTLNWMLQQLPRSHVIQVAQLWQRPCELRDFKQVGHFEVKLWVEGLRFTPCQCTVR